MKYYAICKLENGKENIFIFNDISKYSYLSNLKIFRDIQVYDDKERNIRSLTILDDGSCFAGALLEGNNIMIDK